MTTVPYWATIILSGFAAVILLKGFNVLRAMKKGTNSAIRYSWIMVTFGAFGIFIAPLATVIPVFSMCILLAGEAGLAIFSRRASFNEAPSNRS